MIVLITVITALGVAIFLQVWGIPFIKNKWTLWILSRRLNQIAKRYKDTEIGDKLKEISKGLLELSKNEKFFEDESE